MMKMASASSQTLHPYMFLLLSQEDDQQQRCLSLYPELTTLSSTRLISQNLRKCWSWFQFGTSQSLADYGGLQWKGLLGLDDELPFECWGPVGSPNGWEQIDKERMRLTEYSLRWSKQLLPTWEEHSIRHGRVNTKAHTLQLFLTVGSWLSKWRKLPRLTRLDEQLSIIIMRRR